MPSPFPARWTLWERPRPPPPTPPGCVTPSTPADSDGDGVPDDAIYLFTAPPCRFTGWRGGTLDIVGQLRVQDPPRPGRLRVRRHPDRAPHPLHHRRQQGHLRRDPERHPGARRLRLLPLLLSTDLQVIRTFAGKPDAAIDQQWTLTYAPEQSLQINLAVPGGRSTLPGPWTGPVAPSTTCST